MKKFLLFGNYEAEGAKGLLAEGGTSRRASIEKVAESCGGKASSIYYSFGDTDVYAILEAPDDASAVAISLLVNASGLVTVKTVPLLDPEEIDAAARKNPAYRGPGQ